MLKRKEERHVEHHNVNASGTDVDAMFMRASAINSANTV